MMRSALLTLLIGLLPSIPAAAQTSGELFETKIRPVLINSCFKCHGGDKTSSGLRLDDSRALDFGWRPRSGHRSRSTRATVC